MTTDYTAALGGLTALIILFTTMVAFALSRPSDLPQQSR
jgi:hypothetical protein